MSGGACIIWKIAGKRNIRRWYRQELVQKCYQANFAGHSANLDTLKLTALLFLKNVDIFISIKRNCLFDSWCSSKLISANKSSTKKQLNHNITVSKSFGCLLADWLSPKNYGYVACFAHASIIDDNQRVEEKQENINFTKKFGFSTPLHTPF